MMMSKQFIPLRLPSELFLGKGVHKAVYIDPRDSRRCIKVPFHLPDSDLRKELRYRKALKRRGLEPSLLTKYYGTVETDKGTGFVFERVMDFDGSRSLDLAAYFRRAREQKLGGWPQPAAVLKRFRDLMARECIIIPQHSGYDNMFIQRLAPGEDNFTIRIIDDLGSNTKIPALFYFDFLARRHALKFWKRLVSKLQYDFPEIVTQSFLDKYQLWYF